jgi:chemotaxis protein CheX
VSSFEIHRENGVQKILCPTLIDQKIAEELLQKIQPDITSGDRLVVFDFSKTKDLLIPAYRVFTLLHQALKKNEGYIVSLGLNPALAKQLIAAGLESIFNPRLGIEDAYRLIGQDSPKTENSKPFIDVAFVNPFITATMTTLETQANTRIEACKPHLKTDQDAARIEIIAVISLVSKAFHGNIALCFPGEVFLQIYCNMVGEKHPAITKETEDAAGEILNIIFGQAKAELNDKSGYEIQKAIPAVIRGESIKVHHPARKVAMVLPFKTPHGGFYLEVSVD